MRISEIVNTLNENDNLIIKTVTNKCLGNHKVMHWTPAIVAVGDVNVVDYKITDNVTTITVDVPEFTANKMAKMSNKAAILNSPLANIFC